MESMFGIDAFTYNAEWFKSASTMTFEDTSQKPVPMEKADAKPTHDKGPEKPRKPSTDKHNKYAVKWMKKQDPAYFHHIQHLKRELSEQLGFPIDHLHREGGHRLGFIEGDEENEIPYRLRIIEEEINPIVGMWGGMTGAPLTIGKVILEKKKPPQGIWRAEVPPKHNGATSDWVQVKTWNIQATDNDDNEGNLGRNARMVENIQDVWSDEQTEELDIPCCPPYCPEGANCGPHQPCLPDSVPCERTIGDAVTEGVATFVTTIFGNGEEPTTEIPVEGDDVEIIPTEYTGRVYPDESDVEIKPTEYTGDGGDYEYIDETQEETQDAPDPVDCVMGAWEAWEHNDGNLDGPDWPEWTAHPNADTGQYRERIRYRYAVVNSRYGGKECKSSERTLVEKLPDGRLRETQFENDARDTPDAEGDTLFEIVTKPLTDLAVNVGLYDPTVVVTDAIIMDESQTAIATSLDTPTTTDEDTTTPADELGETPPSDETQEETPTETALGLHEVLEMLDPDSDESTEDEEEGEATPSTTTTTTTTTATIEPEGEADNTGAILIGAILALGGGYYAWSKNVGNIRERVSKIIPKGS